MTFHVVYLIGLVLIGILAVVSIGLSYTKARRRNLSLIEWAKEWIVDFSPELVGAFVTALIFGLFVTVALDTQQENIQKARLVSQLGSENNQITQIAAAELLGYGWLRDGSLKGSNLAGANLQGLFLKMANLGDTWLNWANLRGAFMMNANLQDSNLFAADLCGAFLAYANLKGASLMGANLRDADLMSADLKGADLHQADLRGAVIQWTSFDQNTILPDGSRYDFEGDLDQMRVFTDPDHPEFVAFYDPLDPEDNADSTDCKELRPSDLPR